MLKALNKRHGKLFIQVWAIEQEPPDSNAASEPLKNTRKMRELEHASLSNASLSEDSRQDVFVLWKLQSKASDTPPETYQRYYHLFRQGELRAMLIDAASEVGVLSALHIDPAESYEQGNWCIQATFVQRAE